MRITSIRELDESVTLVGEAINRDRLNDLQTPVRNFVSVNSTFRRLQFKSPIMYSKPVNSVSEGL